MYADTVTESMKRALDETNRRRAKQVKFNEEHGIVPVSIVKAIHDLTEEVSTKSAAEKRAEYKAQVSGGIPRDELQRMISELEKQMKDAARDLQFERAAALRDELYELKGLMAEDTSLKPWQRIKLLSGEE
jgi:excinuclease ABC subunit B